MLQISNLTFAYDNKEVFDRVNIILPDTGIVAVIGDNASGKTTLLKLLCGKLRPDDGTIKIDGSIAYLPQINDNPPDKSGGERTHLALEQIFAREADIVLLDEPTNNLDNASKLWLRNQLLNFRSLSIIVSHDRDFINQIADYILVVENKSLQLYHGSYDDYVARQDQRRIEQISQFDKAQKAAAKVAKQLRDAQAHSDQTNHSHFTKIRDENRMAFRGKRNHAQNTAGKIIRASKTELARLQLVEKPHERKTYQAKIPADFLRRRRLLSINNLTKSYDKRILFTDLNFEIYTGDRYRILGGNGTGKTTLFKIILGEIQSDRGTVKFAPHIKLGYISQSVSGLNLEKSFLSQSDADITEIFRAASTMDLAKQDLASPCGMLSRGQLTKLAFLKIMFSPVDLLILDEPTNHLDIRARENIETALAEYPGAILLATHDERFVVKCLIGKTITLSKTS